MARVFTATSELQALRQEKALLEQRVVDALRKGGSDHRPNADGGDDGGAATATPPSSGGAIAKATAEAADLERSLASLQERIDELEAVLAFHVERRQLLAASVPVADPSANLAAGSGLAITKQLRGSELWSLQFHSTRRQPGRAIPPTAADSVDAAEALGLEEFAVDVARWAAANLKKRITGALVVTATHFYCCLQGPRIEVEHLVEHGIKKDKRHRDIVVVATGYITARTCADGMKLCGVEDNVGGDGALLSLFLDDIRATTVRSAAFAPKAVVDVATRGGDPLASVPATATATVLSISLDALCGAVHRAERFRNATAAIEQAVVPRGGAIASRFGDSMQCYFPLHLRTTPVMAAVEEINANVPYSVQSVVVGDVTTVNAPYCTAFGPGLREGLNLLQHAEASRRPVMASGEAWERCDRARVLFQVFTVDLISFYTLQALGETRLEAAPEPPLIGSYVPGPEPEVHRHTGPTEMQLKEGHRATAADLDAGRKGAAVVPGALTRAQLHRLFRQLDPGNVGWVGKARLKREIESNDAFPTFLLDEKRLDHMLDRCNKLGDERLSFDEFAIVCLKLQQM